MARRPPIRPEVAVIENTDARVITSHLLTKSTRAPGGRLVLARMYRQVAKR